MSNDPDSALEDEMRAWLRAMVDATVTDPEQRKARYAEIDRAISILAEPHDESEADHVT